jgi:N-acetyl-gamma-glutamyl-phosphate reductase
VKSVIFIDGESGTTGLQIHSRLDTRDDIELLTLAKSERKDPSRRAEAINACDIAILCLPDDAARQAVSFITNPKVRVLDASSAHRTTEGWTYGFPELKDGQEQVIAGSRRVSNPGCYPTGALALLGPLTEADILPKDYPVNIHAVSGYSGSGKSLIEAYENPDNPEHTDVPFRGYGLSLEHKHVPEIQTQAQLQHRPIFTPAYGKYRQGIVLYVPIHLRLLMPRVTAKSIHAGLTEHYAGSKYINVVPLEKSISISYLEPEYLNGTNRLDIYVFSNEKAGHVLLAAVYDNLGKGASGAAVQNLNIMLGSNDY